MKHHSNSFHAVLGLLAFGLTAIFHPATAKEVFVDAKVANSGSGSEQSPFKTIAEAVNALDKVGGTATIKSGVYRENVTIAKGGVENSPLVLRAAAGERVCITGCDPVTGWKMEGKLATLISKEPVYDLFVREQRQRCSRFPDIQSPWTRVTAAGAGNEVQVEAVPKLSAGQEKGLCASLSTRSSENFCGLLTNFNASAKSFPFSVGS